MNIFELSWSWYEDKSSYYLGHNNKTSKEFKLDVKHIMNKFVDAFIVDRNNFLITAPEFIEYIIPMFNNLGYVTITTNAEYSVDLCGDYIIGKRTSDSNQNLHKFINKKNYEKIKKHNF